MTIEVIRSQIERFLASRDPEVLAIHGKWGVGKTYSWNKFLRDTKDAGRIAMSRYSYVSLFGVNSLDAFRYALFEQVVKRELIGKEPNIDTLRDNTAGLAESLGRKALRILNPLLARGASPAIESLSFLSIRETLICIDDLERRGDNLSLKDVLELVSLLKERKACKIVLLLNDGEAKLEEYETYKEKVVDIELEFAPTAKECAQIAIPQGDYAFALLRSLSEELDISNIRTLKKIERLIKLALPLLARFEQDLTEKVVRSLTLYGWCRYRSGNSDIPTLEYTLDFRLEAPDPYGLTDKKKKSPEEERWDAKLRRYGYMMANEFDHVMANIVQAGYIDEPVFTDMAERKNAEILAAKATGSFSEAWKPFYESFGDNKDAVIDSIYNGFKATVKYIAPMELIRAVNLFRKLGEDKKADAMIESYAEARASEVELFNLEKLALFCDVSDERLQKCFSKIHQKSVEKESVQEVLLKIAGSNGWSQTDEMILADASAEDFYGLFTAEVGEHLYSCIYACSEFGRVSDATPRIKRIAENSKQALKRIASESEINALRVRGFGVLLDEDA